MAQPALFRWFPRLGRQLPWLSLGCNPTPVHRLELLGHHLKTSRLWIKRDDLCGRIYGGNKPRKLEFLLAAAQQQGARTLLTFGAPGSQHAMATALYARELGMHTTAVLAKRPLTPIGRKNLKAAFALGTELVYASSDVHLGWCAAKTWWDLTRRDGRFPFVIPPGGSSARGCLGYVNAGLELAEQIQAGTLLPPDDIYLSVGSMGTMAGLLVGLRLGKISSRIVGVKISEDPFSNARGVAWLARWLMRFLRQHDDSIPPLPFEPRKILVRHDCLGPGYGHTTQESLDAVALLRETEALQLDSVYTGKTLAALQKAAAAPGFRHRRILFWNTFNSLSYETSLPPTPPLSEMPAPFAALLEEGEKNDEPKQQNAL